MKPAFIYFLAMCSIVFAAAQHVGSIDLTHPPEPNKSAEDGQNVGLPPGCAELSGGGIADGVVLPQDREPRRLTVRIAKIFSEKPALGDEVRAEVELKNTDKRALDIPWTADPDIAYKNQDPWDLQWDAATFIFSLSDAHHHTPALKSQTEWLYGSRQTPASYLTLQPGTSITALVAFQLDAKYGMELHEGKWSLLAEWHQVSRYRYIKDCGVWNGFYPYRDFYAQTNVPFPIRIGQPTQAKN
jgi:hypothetical protein